MIKKYILTLICSFVVVSMSTLAAEGKQSIGWLELVKIYPGNLKMRAKIDTGAKSSSINALNLELFERDSEPWVRFKLRDMSTLQKTRTITLEKKILRSIKIKRKGGGLDERVVVALEICIGGIHKKIEMNLMDRSNFNYQVLIGRTDLENDFLVDPSVTFTRKPVCKVTVELKQPLEKDEKDSK